MTYLNGRTARRSLHSRSPLLPRLLIFASLALLVAGCGVKNELMKPNGQATPKDTSDPSKPPYPLGR
jgi:hypothetical protein